MFNYIKKEERDHRYLGAVRFIDPSTNSPVHRAFHIAAPGLRFSVNRQFIYVITHANDLTHHLEQFEKPPGDPVIDSLEFTLSINDPLGKYLPRIARIKLPRNPQAESANNIFSPMDIVLSHAPIASTQPNWSLIRISVFDQADRLARNPVVGALIRLTKINGNSDTQIYSGISDKRGEALIALAGIPITDYSHVSEVPEPPVPGSEEHNEWLATGPVVEQKTKLNLQVITHPETLWPVDTDQLELNQNEWQRRIAIGDTPVSDDPIVLNVVTGNLLTLTLFVELPN